MLVEPLALEGAQGTVSLAVCIRRGVWLVETGGPPPLHHAPAVLLDGFDATESAAVSVTTAIALKADLAASIAAMLSREGAAIAPLGILALHEIILNAALHGNLGMTSGRLSKWSDLVAREALLADALSRVELAARVVTVAVAWTPGISACAAVADEGAGYQVDEAEHASVRGNRRAAGRGLMLAHAGAEVEILHGGCCTRLAFRVTDQSCSTSW